MDGQTARERHRNPLRVAVLLLAALAVLSALGSLFPAMPQNIASDPDQRLVWLQAAGDRYGIRATLYDALGLFGTFRSVWFWAVLGIVGIKTAGLCSQAHEDATAFHSFRSFRACHPGSVGLSVGASRGTATDCRLSVEHLGKLEDGRVDPLTQRADPHRPAEPVLAATGRVSSQLLSHRRTAGLLGTNHHPVRR